MEVSKQQMAVAFNRWMAAYTEHPEAFRREWETVVQFLREAGNAEKPSYGRDATEYFVNLLEAGSAMAGPANLTSPPAEPG